MSKENEQERRRLETRIHEHKMSEAQDTLAELRQNTHTPPVKKARIEGNKASASASASAYQLSCVKDVAELALHKLDSWSAADIKKHIDSLCGFNSVNYSGIETKEELERLLTRFWLCNPERMPEYRAMMKKK